MLKEILGLSEAQFISFFLAFARISALVAVAPFFGSRAIPRKVKAFSALFLTMAILPMIQQEVSADSVTLLTLVPLTLKEAFMGVFLGFSAKLLFESFSFAGRVISRQMGLALSQIVDPESGAQVTPVGTIYALSAILLFLQFDGHHMLLAALYRSFELVPVGGMTGVAPAGGVKLLAMFNELFVIGIKLAAPSMVILFLMEASMGIIARIVPQMNIFFIGLPLRLGVGLLVVVASLPIFYMLFETTFNVWSRDLLRLIHYF